MSLANLLGTGWLVLMILPSSLGFSQPIRTYKGQTIWDLPNVPEDQVDIGLWALIISKEHDPSVDVDKDMKYIDGWAEVISSVMTDRSLDVYVLAAADEVMFRKGPWNGYRPVGYDYDDPFGVSFLSEYLDTRRGNCVSMPTLLLAIVERIDPDIPFFGAHAPMHMYCILKDRATGQSWNAEATNGGASRDAHIIKAFNVPREGIEKGAYMRPLRKKEFLAGVIMSLVSERLSAKDYRKALAYNDLALALFPEFGGALWMKGVLLHTMGWEEYVSPIETRKKILTPEIQKMIESVDREGNRYFEMARSLGWREVTDEDQAGYLQAISLGKNIQDESQGR